MKEGPALPQELSDLIVDHLFDDLETLRSCALVSSSFLPWSRAHIFSHLRIGPIDPEQSIRELHELLRKLPSLANRVESLHLWDNTMRPRSWIEEYPDSSVPSVAQLSNLLVSLARLSITIESSFVHWANISSTLRSSIRFMVALQTLTSLQLTGLYGLPFTLLAHCPALRSVTLKWVTFDERDNLDFAKTLAACAGSPPTQLEDLSIDLDTRVLGLLARWILLPQSPIDITRLRSLSCTVDGRFDHLAIQRLLNACAPSLQRLRLKNVAGTLDLRNLAQLHTLCLEVAPPLESRVVWFMDNIVFPPPQQALGLVLRVATPSAVQLVWADRALALFPCITSVTAIFETIDEEARERDLVDVSGAFVHRMPSVANRLAGRGPLRVLRSPRCSLEA
ncbi:hypothetical protein DFH07DRAFT_948428 [Mycena maculata]|uniref:Uncharacterized protein n=1 Tax=Mycena maculata TaxID=230809 RepID=A0AAD7KGZ9_9AGAR|nr:hypothetical protein DFH07DRAFT_948428 [Mycena maculata]